jgi:hypothetical protein
MRRIVAPAAVAFSRMAQNYRTGHDYLINSILKLGQPITHFEKVCTSAEVVKLLTGKRPRMGKKRLGHRVYLVPIDDYLR